jgi:hypothetical protein
VPERGVFGSRVSLASAPKGGWNGGSPAGAPTACPGGDMLARTPGAPSVGLRAQPNPKACYERQVIGSDARQAGEVHTKGLSPDGVIPVDPIQGP